MLEGVLQPDDPKAKLLYETFNARWPHWTSLSFPDTYPWALVSQAAALMSDTKRAELYVTSIAAKYVQAGFPSPWYCAESGWFIRVNADLLRKAQDRNDTTTSRSF